MSVLWWNSTFVLESLRRRRKGEELREDMDVLGEFRRTEEIKVVES